MRYQRRDWFASGVAQEVRKQKIEEAQYISEAVLDAEVRLGKLMKALPKATPNNNPFHENDSGVDFVKPKTQTIKDAGFTPKQAERFQPCQISDNPDNLHNCVMRYSCKF